MAEKTFWEKYSLLTLREKKAAVVGNKRRKKLLARQENPMSDIWNRFRVR